MVQLCVSADRSIPKPAGHATSASEITSPRDSADLRVYPIASDPLGSLDFLCYSEYLTRSSKSFCTGFARQLSSTPMSYRPPPGATHTR
jgi:hypothetical protein